MKFTWLDKYTRVIAMLPPDEGGLLAIALAKYGSLAEEPQGLPFQAQLAFEALREDVEYSRNMTEKGIKSGESRRSRKSYKQNSEIVTNECVPSPRTTQKINPEPETPQEVNALSTPPQADTATTDERAHEDTTNDIPLESRTDKEHEVAPVQEKTASAFKQNARTEHTTLNEPVHANSANGAPESTRTKAMHSIAIHSKAIDKEKNILKKEKFAKPSVDEVRTYVSEEHLSVDPERFCTYYDSVGWRVGKNPMKSWKAACRTWDINAQKSAKSAGEDLYANDFERKVGHDVYAQLAIYN